MEGGQEVARKKNYVLSRAFLVSLFSAEGDLGKSHVGGRANQWQWIKEEAVMK